MAETNRDKEIREEIAAARRKPRRERRPAGRRVLWLALTLLAVLGAVYYASARGLDSMDALRRLFAYNKVEQDAEGRSELLRYDSDRSASYAALGDGLLIVSTTRARLLDGAGEELWAKAVSFQHPAIARGGKTAAVYDVGGTELYILDARGLARDMSGESGNGILAVSLNASDYLALTTLGSGCRAAVTAYDPDGAPVFAFRSSERYLSDARVLDDNRHLAAVTLGEAGGAFASTLTFYAFDREKALSETTFGGELVLSLGSVDGKLAALEDGRLTLFGADGSLAGSYRFEYPYLRGVSTDGGGFAALLLSRYRSGSTLRLVTLGGDGDVLGTLDERREVLDVSAAGRYVALLYGDSLTIYTADLAEYATLDGTDFARQVIMRADGTALLLGASKAWLYIP